MDGADGVARFAIWYVVFLLSLTLHEAGHALVAWLGGDDTAYRGGQVSLNPVPHMRREPFGTILFPLITYVSSGWMMGWASSPYDPRWGQAHPRRMAAMSAAGPAGNLLIASIAFIALKAFLAMGLFVAPARINFSQLVQPPAGTPAGSLAYPAALFLSVALNLNLLLFLFNLLPLPPMDGAGIIEGLIPGPIGGFFAGLRRQPMMAFLGLMLAWRVFDVIYQPAFAILLKLLHPDASYG